MKYPHCIPIIAPLYHHIFCRKVLLNVQPAVAWAGVSKAEVGTRALTWRKEVPGGDIHVGEDVHWDDIYNVYIYIYSIMYIIYIIIYIYI